MAKLLLRHVYKVYPGDAVSIKFNEQFVHLFDKETEQSIMSREYGNK